MRRRLDRELVRRGLVNSEDDMVALIAEHRVTVNGAVALKLERMVDGGDAVAVLAPPPRFVSRAGAKLAGALETFAIDVTGLRCFDAGSSTGGFTDCLLQAGAAAVVAVDVGTHQLHERLRSDVRVSVHEQTNVRDIDVDRIGGPVDLIVADLSFVSIRTVLSTFATLVAPGSSVITLIKPQFEATKLEADQGRGIISDADIWHRVVEEVRLAALELSHPLVMMDLMVSPITGAHGNVEFVARFVTHADPHTNPRADRTSPLATSAHDVSTVVARAAKWRAAHHEEG